jgi:hypothetical protein
MDGGQTDREKREANSHFFNLAKAPKSKFSGLDDGNAGSKYFI